MGPGLFQLVSTQYKIGVLFSVFPHLLEPESPQSSTPYSSIMEA